MDKNRKILLLTLVAILLGIWLFYSFSKTQNSPPSENLPLTDTQKEDIAKIMNQKLKNVPPLTNKQKEDIAKKMMKSLLK